MRIKRFLGRSVAAVALAAAFPQTASAATYFYCYVDTSSLKTVFVSDIKRLDNPVAMIPKGREYWDQVRRDFDRLYPGDAKGGHGRYDCNSSGNLETLKSARSRYIKNGAKPVLFLKPPVPSTSVFGGSETGVRSGKSGGGSGLVIEDRRDPADSAETRDARPEVLRKDAAKRAAEAAEALRKSPQVDEHIKQMLGKKRRVCSMTGTACPQ